MADLFAQRVQNTTTKIQQGIKARIFDILGAVILIALIALSLGVLERRIITLAEIGDIIVECIPFFLAAMLLGNNFYMKGVFLGKTAPNFIAACKEYSDIVASLTGEQIDYLDDFCQEYNDDALKKKQHIYLNKASISYEKFNGDKDETPIKTMSDKELKAKYGDERASWIIKAKNCTVKGLRVNSLMGTNDNDDVTDIGLNEAQLSKKRLTMSAISYAASTVVMSLVAVKNVNEWGWFGIALVLFKCIYILVKSYMSYFDGYNDMTIHLVHHTTRKTDILKQFIYWYGNKIKNL